MNWESRYIKKLMGWCPNAKTNEAKKTLTLKVLNPIFRVEKVEMMGIRKIQDGSKKQISKLL